MHTFGQFRVSGKIFSCLVVGVLDFDTHACAFGAPLVPENQNQNRTEQNKTKPTTPEIRDRTRLESNIGQMILHGRYALIRAYLFLYACTRHDYFAVLAWFAREDNKPRSSAAVY